MHGIIAYIFDCWAYPVVHLLIPKSSMVENIHYWGKDHCMAVLRFDQIGFNCFTIHVGK